jgi:CHAD domain-containing protein
MATAIRETERKYEAPPGVPLPDLRDLPRVATQSPDGEVRLDATYHDTATYDLARAGITLRRRTGGEDAGWHLKVPENGSGTRTELRLPDGPELPAEFVGLLTARLRGRALRPVAMITTRRRLSTLADAAGDPLAEIALDTVTAEALGHQSALTRWSEVEVELAQGVDDGDGGRLLKAADRRLRRSGLTRSQHRMKLEVALAGALPEQVPASLRRKSITAGEVVLAYLRNQFEELLRRDLLVRRAEPDAIHRMRVAARRTRAALQEFRKLFRGAEIEQLISELRWLGQELGAARDEEVLRDLLLEELDEVPVESVLGPVRARIVGHFAPRLAEAERRLHETLDSPRYLALLDELEAFVANPPAVADAERRAAAVLPRLVQRSQGRVKRRMRVARLAPIGERRDHALHDARKAAKRARYAAEAASLALGRQPRKSAKALEKLQSTLGDHHDAVIAAHALRTLAITVHGEGENSYTYGLLRARQDERAERLAQRAHREWRRANRSKRTAWLR